MSPGTPLQIFVADTGPHKAIVKWIADGEAGVGFLQPLSDALFSSFQTTHVPDVAKSAAPAEFDDMKGMTPQRFC